MLHAFEREWLPVYKMGWRTHLRVSFQMDGKHPMGHHQKRVMIDDKLAFVRGLDPTCSRRDTPEHAVVNPHRRDVNEQPYQPFHDVHTMFDGDAARETLEKPDGLDLAIIAPRKQRGWLQEMTMGVLRARLHGFLTTGIA
ncbi:hypothetical protein LJR034_006160 [Caballeronia sp. LjRoot34]|uniref:hypothetical protein n=1 Tax=Caballeronia sp. LjRoot34 TaxID=3342325 RepID=UPI003ED168EC